MEAKWLRNHLHLSEDAGQAAFIAISPDQVAAIFLEVQQRQRSLRRSSKFVVAGLAASDAPISAFAVLADDRAIW